MKKLILVEGDHPILKRIYEYHHSMDNVNKLVDLMKEYNYENIKVGGKEIKNEQEII